LDAITKWKLLAAVILVICTGQCAVPVCAGPQNLHAQAAAALLARDFNDPDLSYLLLDENGRPSDFVARGWDPFRKKL